MIRRFETALLAAAVYGDLDCSPGLLLSLFPLRLLLAVSSLFEYLLSDHPNAP